MKKNWRQVEHVIFLSGCNDLQHLLSAWLKASTRCSDMYAKLSPEEKCLLSLKHSNDYFTNATAKNLRKYSNIIRDYLITVQKFIAASVPNLKSISFCSILEREDTNQDNIHLLFSYLNSKFAQINTPSYLKNMKHFY